MKSYASTLISVFTRKDGREVVLVTFIFFVALAFFLQNGTSAYEVLSFQSLSPVERSILWAKVLFSVEGSFTPSGVVLMLLASFLGSYNTGLAYIYMYTRGKSLLRGKIHNGVGIIIAFLGIGCSACGTALVAVILSGLGLSSVLGVLPHKGEEIAYLGVLVLFIGTYTLVNKLRAPLVC